MNKIIHQKKPHLNEVRLLIFFAQGMEVASFFSFLPAQEAKKDITYSPTR